MVTKMRSWRKIHAALIDSERAPQLSDSALALFFLLVMGQDDEGFFPWSTQAVRRLTINRSWSLEQTSLLASELVAVGMAFWDEGGQGIILDKGEFLNGRPRKYREPLTYRPRPNLATEMHEAGDQHEADRRPAIDKRRLDKEEETDRESEPEESDTDSPILLQGDISGQFSPQELQDLRVSFPRLDLEIEAEKCLAWYQSRGDGIRDARTVFVRWLERARPPNGALPLAKANHSEPARELLLWNKPPLPASETAAEVWERCKELLKERIAAPIFATWLAETHGYACEDDRFWVQAKSPFVAEWLYRRAVRLCEDALRDAGRPNAELCLFVEPAEGELPAGNSESSISVSAQVLGATRSNESGERATTRPE